MASTNRERCRAWYYRHHEEAKRRGRERYRNNMAYRAQLEDARLRRIFGITLDDYRAMLTAQGGGCAICGGHGHRLNRVGLAALHVDHDHVTVKVRGLLCDNCNSGLGHFRDKPALLEAALAYLKLVRG